MNQVICADVMEWAASYDGLPFHSMITDPPYHLHPSMTRSRPDLDDYDGGKGNPYARQQARSGFMSSAWDGGDIAFRPETWAALSRHLLPGAFVMAFGGSRGFHRLACAMEDAGLRLHPTIGWLFASGFPKASRIDTAVDAAAGAERPDKLHGGHIGYSVSGGDPDNENELGNTVPHVIGKGALTGGTPATPLAKAWAGHRYGGQALKPALEFIVVAQVPYGKSKPVDSIVATGAGALNVDVGRIGVSDADRQATAKSTKGSISVSEQTVNICPQHYGEPVEYHPAGRWPANFACDQLASEALDRQSGVRTSGVSDYNWEPSGNNNPVGIANNIKSGVHYGDSGGISRMFHVSDWNYEVEERLALADAVRYCPKASTAERNAGLRGPQIVSHATYGDFKGTEEHASNTRGAQRNTHPCVKSISLNKWLASLLLPPKEYAPRRILCPFSGVSSEMIGAALAGFEEVVGIEMDAEYVRIGQARLDYWASTRQMELEL